MHFSPLILFHPAGGEARPSGELFSRKTGKVEKGGGNPVKLVQAIYSGRKKTTRPSVF